jgi:hypothetical protein
VRQYDRSFRFHLKADTGFAQEKTRKTAHSALPEVAPSWKMSPAINRQGYRPSLRSFSSLPFLSGTRQFV